MRKAVCDQNRWEMINQKRRRRKKEKERGGKGRENHDDKEASGWKTSKKKTVLRKQDKELLNIGENEESQTISGIILIE